MKLMIPKPKHKRRKPKRSKRGEFSKKTIEAIYKRDAGLCQICASKGHEIHHCKFKSQGGRGVYQNGLLLCSNCHTKVHQSFELAEKLRERMMSRYGADYFRDRWDLND